MLEDKSHVIWVPSNMTWYSQEPQLSRRQEERDAGTREEGQESEEAAAKSLL